MSRSSLVPGSDTTLENKNKYTFMVYSVFVKKHILISRSTCSRVWGRKLTGSQIPVSLFSDFSHNSRAFLTFIDIQCGHFENQCLIHQSKKMLQGITIDNNGIKLIRKPTAYDGDQCLIPIFCTTHKFWLLNSL